MPLLTSQHLENIRNYKYHGADTSYTYIYVLSPWAQFCVDTFVPLWMAPNLITLLGLFASVVSTTCVLLYNPTLSADGPRWLAALTGICLFLYQTLDNMDGKQARRTGSGSALGELFDHGCDAINAGLAAIPVSSTLGTGWTMGIFFCLWCSMVPFYFETWEEYHVGSMILPFFNGPSDCLCLAVLMCFVTYFYGAQYWHTPCISHATIESFTGIHPIHPESSLSANMSFDQMMHHVNPRHILTIVASQFTLFHAAVAFVLIVAIITCMVSVYKVIKVVIGKKHSLIGALAEIVPFLIFFTSMFIYCWSSEIALSKYPLWTMLYMGSTNVEVVSHVMLMHISKGSISPGPFHRITAWLTLLLPLYVYYQRDVLIHGGQRGGQGQGQGQDINISQISPYFLLSMVYTFISEIHLLQIMAIGSLVNTSITLYRMCTEIAAFLKIGVFVLKQKKT